jgi:hypothetical protein
MTTLREARQTQREQVRLAITAALDAANGKRRVRTLAWGDVCEAIREALTETYAFRAAETVANAYPYPAIRTACYAALRSDGRVALAIGTTYATKGSCPRPHTIAHAVTQVRPDSPRVRAIALRWADSVDDTETIHGLVLIPRRVALHLTHTDRRTP